MKANKINQIHSEFAGIESSNMTIDDLIRLTEVDVFDPRTFKGYQREINEKHVSKIEKYIQEVIFEEKKAIRDDRKCSIFTYRLVIYWQAQKLLKENFQL